MVKVEVIGTKVGENESTETYWIQLPLDASGTDAMTFVNNLLAWCLGAGPKYERIAHFRIAGVYRQVGEGGIVSVQAALMGLS
jgi:hypothetical protein